MNYRLLSAAGRGLLLAGVFFWSVRLVAEPPIDAELAIKQFKVPTGFKVDLFAAEPQLENPVAFCFDEHGRVYVAETFRYGTSVYDIRDHMDMYNDDLASRTVEDRAAMIKKFLGPKEGDLARESELVRLIEDRDGDGRADHSTVFAGGFNTVLDGIGSGVLARKGTIYYTDIPNLWSLRDTKGTGTADERRSLAYGFGVHFGFTGHDLHGLRIGPDGKLYFSIGDRGIHVRTREGNLLDYPDMGSVLRCNLDGSDLEVFAYGLRNPQELAFDDYGNLFTGDNNCDHGDAARLVYVVEDGDSGWRIANQFSDTTPAGVWNSEKLWYLQYPGQAAYIVPPVAHIADGPSGISHYPGTGFPDSFKDHFFLCDFRGASVNSGVHTFAMNPKGAGFEMVDHSHFFWNILATDVEFSPDGQMYVSDWVRGWPQSTLGRIYRLYDPDLVKSAPVLETKNLIAGGMEGKTADELSALLGHADQRVRMEAQFEIANRILNTAGMPDFTRKYVDALVGVASKNGNQLARLHAIWGLGQIGRVSNAWIDPILPLLEDRDAEVRAQTAKIIGDAHYAAPYRALIKLLADPSLRVRFFAAQSLGKLKKHDAVGPLLAMLRENADKDVFLRHAGVMGLVGTADESDLQSAAPDSSRSVRMAVLLVMRRMHSPQVAGFLRDSDELIVLEAARAVNDLTMTGAMPALAKLINHPTTNAPLDWRVVNANFRIGGAENATALANYALETNAPAKARGEAVFALSSWAHPSKRDRITGLWRPLEDRDGKVAAEALGPVIGSILKSAPSSVRLEAVDAAAILGIQQAAPMIFDLATDTKQSSEVRVASLKALGGFHHPKLAEAVQMAVNDPDEDLRKEGIQLRAELDPSDAVRQLAKVLTTGSIAEKQGAFTTLGSIKGEAADKLLAEWLDKLIAGGVPKEIQLDLVETAGKRASTLVVAKLAQYQASQPKDDEFFEYRETLYGGSAAAGRKIFLERPDASCVRCHKLNGEGGQVGPELAGVGARHDREYILESILFPNKVIAPGYESVVVVLKDGSSVAGILRNQDANELTILSVEDSSVVKVKESDVKKVVKGQSAMPGNLGGVLSKLDLRNLVEFLATLK